MSFVSAGAAIIGGSIISGGLGAAGAIYAATQQRSSEQQALALQNQEYNQAQAQLAPYENIGAGATYSLGSLYGIGSNGQPNPAGTPINYSQFTNSPDYQFAFQQGQSALQNQLNASGLAGSGAGEAAAVQYGQGLATQQYSNYFNRLLSLSGIGAQAAGQGAQTSASAAGTIGNTIGNIGASTASGIVGGTNALTGGINSGISNSLLYNAISRGQNVSSYAPITTTGLNFGVPNTSPYAAYPEV